MIHSIDIPVRSSKSIPIRFAGESSPSVSSPRPKAPGHKNTPTQSQPVHVHGMDDTDADRDRHTSYFSVCLEPIEFRSMESQKFSPIQSMERGQNEKTRVADTKESHAHHDTPTRLPSPVISLGPCPSPPLLRRLNELNRRIDQVSNEHMVGSQSSPTQMDERQLEIEAVRATFIPTISLVDEKPASVAELFYGAELKQSRESPAASVSHKSTSSVIHTPHVLGRTPLGFFSLPLPSHVARSAEFDRRVLIPIDDSLSHETDTNDNTTVKRGGKTEEKTQTKRKRTHVKLLEHKENDKVHVHPECATVQVLVPKPDSIEPPRGHLENALKLFSRSSGSRPPINPIHSWNEREWRFIIERMGSKGVSLQRVIRLYNPRWSNIFHQRRLLFRSESEFSSHRGQPETSDYEDQLYPYEATHPPIAQDHLWSFAAAQDEKNSIRSVVEHAFTPIHRDYGGQSVDGPPRVTLPTIFTSQRLERVTNPCMYSRNQWVWLCQVLPGSKVCYFHRNAYHGHDERLQEFDSFIASHESPADKIYEEIVLTKPQQVLPIWLIEFQY